MSPNNVHDSNYPFACYVFSSRIISLLAGALPQRLPLTLLSFHILPHTVKNTYLSSPSCPPTQHHAISKVPRPSPSPSPPPSRDHATTHRIAPHLPTNPSDPFSQDRKPQPPIKKRKHVQRTSRITIPSPSPYLPAQPPLPPPPRQPRATIPIKQPYHF